MQSDRPRRVRDGENGLARYDCPNCGRLLLQYGPDLVGGPVVPKCRCGEKTEIYFNRGPE